MSLRADLAREDELLLAGAQLGVLEVELVQLPRVQAHLNTRTIRDTHQLRAVLSGTVLYSSTTVSQKCETVPRRARM